MRPLRGHDIPWKWKLKRVRIKRCQEPFPAIIAYLVPDTFFHLTPFFICSVPGDASPRHCVVLVPFQGRIVSQCQTGLLELERRGYTVRQIEGYSAIDQARNQLSSDALADGFDETMC